MSKQSPKDQKRTCGAILLLALLLIGLVYFLGLPLFPATIISITQCNVEQTGHVGENNQWSGSFWNIFAVNDISASQVSLLKFNKSLVDSYGANYILTQNVEPTARIDITITALQPYFTLPTVIRDYIVYPKTYGTDISFLGGGQKAEKVPERTIPQLTARCYVFSPQDPGSWEQHTPFHIKIQKVNGSNPFTWEQTLDTVGGTNTVVCTNPADSSEAIMIKDLGVLGTSWQAGPPFSHVVIIDQYHAFVYDSNLIKDLCYDTSLTTGQKLNDYSYSQYWFGGGDYYLDDAGGGYLDHLGRWPDDHSPGFYTADGVAWLTHADQWPGQKEEGEWNVPIAADIFNDNPDTWSYIHQGIGKSLVNYLQNIRNYEYQNLDTWSQGASIQGDGKLRVNLPYGAASSVVQIRVSTEIADAVVVKEQITNPQITKSVWLSNQGSDVTIPDHDTAVVSVRQDEPDVMGGVFVTATLSPADIPALLDFTQLQKQMSYNENYDFKFTLTNNNPGTTTLDGTITFEATNANGEVCSTSSLTFSLPPKGVVTRLTVLTVDKEIKIRINGIPITVEYGTESQFGYTDRGEVSFDLGAFTGTATITAAETTAYKGATVNPPLNSGPNTVTLELERIGTPPPPNYWLWIVIGIIVAATAVAIALVWKKKK